MKIGNRRKKLMKTIGIKDDYKKIPVLRERLHDFWRYFNFASCSNILELTDIVLSLLLAYFDVLSPWYYECAEIVCISCSDPCSSPELTRTLLPEMRAAVFLVAWRNALGFLLWSEKLAGNVIPIVRSVNAIWPLLIWTLNVWIIFSQVMPAATAEI